MNEMAHTSICTTRYRSHCSTGKKVKHLEWISIRSLLYLNAVIEKPTLVTQNTVGIRNTVKQYMSYHSFAFRSITIPPPAAAAMRKIARMMNTSDFLWKRNIRLYADTDTFSGLSSSGSGNVHSWSACQILIAQISEKAYLESSKLTNL